MLSNVNSDALRLDLLLSLAHLLRDIVNLNRRVRLDDAQQILLEQRVVQRREMRADRRVR